MKRQIYIHINQNTYIVNRGIARQISLAPHEKSYIFRKSQKIYAVPISRSVYDTRLNILRQENEYIYYYILPDNKRVLISSTQMKNIFNTGVITNEHRELINKDLYIMEANL